MIYKKLHEILNLGNLNTVILRIAMSLLMGVALLQAESPVSNETLAETAVLRVIDSVFAELDRVPSGIILEIGSVTGERRGFLNQTVIRHFLDRNITIDKPDSECRLNIEQFEADIVYRQKKSSLFGLSDIYQRELSLVFVGWIREPDGEIKRFINTRKRFQDEVTESRIGELQNGSYRFLQGEIVQSSVWLRVVEPALVVLSVSTVVYLFFTMRT